MDTFLSWLGKLWLKMVGWKIVGNPLPADKYVLACAFHTTNWDFTTCVATRAAVKAPVTWIGKHTIFMWPFGGLMRLLGGFPVNRNLKMDIVSQIVAEFKKRDRFGVAIFPEGTRKRVSHWKTGFYQIAIQAGVPIQPAILNYDTNSFVFGELFYPTGDYEKDLEALRPFFMMAVPKYPEKADKNFISKPQQKIA